MNILATTAYSTSAFSSPFKLLLYERNWLNRWKTLVLHEGEGMITNVKWRANLIAWANNLVSDGIMNVKPHVVS